MSEKEEELHNPESGDTEKTELSVAAESHVVVNQSATPVTALTEQQLKDSDRARQEEEWRSDLFRLENEMSTLRSVLNAKIKEAEELKKKLGITPLVEFKEDIRHGFQSFKESEPIQKTSTAFKGFGEYASKKLDNIRNSTAFKSVEEKVGGAYSTVKKRISSNKSEDDEVQEATEDAFNTTSAPTSEVFVPLQP